MKKMLILLVLLSSCASTQSLESTSKILPEPTKPEISHINWAEISKNNKIYYLLDKKNMDILNNNLLNILDYQRKQSSLIHYYENLNK